MILKVIVGQGKRKLEADAWTMNDPYYFEGKDAVCIVFKDGKKEYAISLKLPTRKVKK
jgi:hypothetical protein